MKKLFYIIPVILAILCALHFNVHNDTINHNPQGDLASLKPSHWKTREYNIDASVSLAQPSSAGSSSQTNTPLSQRGKFYGFPFGFYVVNQQSTANSSVNFSAYSWLWATVDGLLIILTIVLAFFINRRETESESTTQLNNITTYSGSDHNYAPPAPQGRQQSPPTISPQPPEQTNN
jgi:hypothetical protein